MRPGAPLSPVTGTPVLIQTGDADAYTDPVGGEKLVAFLPPEDARHVRLITHRGAGHGFNRDREAKVIDDPFAHNGKGGEVLMAFHPATAAAARAAMVGFFIKVLRPDLARPYFRSSRPMPGVRGIGRSEHAFYLTRAWSSGGSGWLLAVLIPPP